ncbi:DEAD/DEAH box helicase [bacterium]|nr:DEAD/DEAH box helicase [bacterium]
MTHIKQLVKQLTQDREFSKRIAHYRYLDPVKASYKPLDKQCPSAVRAAVAEMGISKLFSHQVQALDLLRKGRHVGITTPTASGKTLIYNIAVSEMLLKHPDAHALYLFPLKALAQDQLKTLKLFFKQIGGAGLNAAVYDGDTSASMRSKIKKNPPQVIFTNPDMLHFGMLAYPEGWKTFFSKLRYLVIDEAHTYRGVFGSHVAMILRRLRRFCHEKELTVIAGSATMANAQVFLETLTGLPFTIVEKSGAPRQGRHVILINPLGSPYSDAAVILQKCLEQSVKTILFTKSRKIAELIHIWVKQGMPEFAAKIAAYRAGYLPEERRKIEQQLFENKLEAVISTSALEAGIDVGGLDAAVLVGYPGTMISTWQRVGRAGRQDRDAVMILIALPDALDQYFLRHPDAFFDSKFENCVLDPNNVQLLKKHLPCASAEMVLTKKDKILFGETAWESMKEMVKEGLLHEAADGKRWMSPLQRPHRLMDIRSVGAQYMIKQDRDGIVLGSIDEPRVFKECHPGAVYLHAGVQYEVVGLDLDNKVVMIRETKADWYTQYTASEEVAILELAETEQVRASAEKFQAGLVHVRVTEKIVSYERRRMKDQSLLSEHKLDLPPRVFETQAILLTVPEVWRKRCLDHAMDFGGGLHAVEHTLIAALPVKVLCDRWDLGGLSTLAHPQVSQPCMFVYDGFPGGIGLVSKGLEVLESWIKTTKEMVETCACEDGCPACIHSPKCGSRNQPLDKQACQMILTAMTQQLPGSLTIAKHGVFSYAPVQTARKAEHPAVSDHTEVIAPYKQSLDKRKGYHMLVFDLETQKSAADVGGWNNSHKMRMSLGVVYDHTQDTFTTYREEKTQELMQHLLSADVVVGFNIDGFDLKVLSPYSPYVDRMKTLDILKDVHRVLGYRLSLDHLATHTLGRGKTAEGLQAITWFENGKWAELEAYCQADVAVTRDLFYFGIKFGYLLYERRGEMLKVPVDWHDRFPEILVP